MTKIIHTLFLFLCLLLSGSAYAKWDYKKVQSANECGECHEEEVEVWKETKHFKTFKKFSQNKDAKKIAKKMGVKRIKTATTLCTGCHYTVGVKRGKKKVVSGISCESCHSPSADWIEIHNDYGGKGIKKKQESAAHKKERHAKLEELGMKRPANIYGWAKNCYNCHIVAKEKLVNIGGHKAGSDFKLFKRTQGKILHTDKATEKKANLIKLIGYAVELELSLRAVSEATGGNKYSDKMIKRAQAALVNLKKTNNALNNIEISTVIARAISVDIKPGNASALNPISDAISVAARIVVENEMGYRYANLDRSVLRSDVKLKAVKTNLLTKPVVTKPVVTKPVVTKPVVTKLVVTKSSATQPAVTPETKRVLVKKPLPTTETVPKNQLAKLSASVGSVSPTKQTRHYSKANLIRSFELLTPRNPALCNTFSPWILGETKLGNNVRLNDQSCLGLSVSPINDGWLYLYAETKNGELTRLLPNKCNAMSLLNNQIRGGITTHVPLDKNAQQSVLSLVKYPDVTGFYAILVDTDNARNIVDQQNENISDLCNSAPSKGDLQDIIAKLINQTNGHLDWKYQHFLRE